MLLNYFDKNKSKSHYHCAALRAVKTEKKLDVLNNFEKSFQANNNN